MLVQNADAIQQALFMAFGARYAINDVRIKNEAFAEPVSARSDYKFV
jgi:hypothetical protein